MTVLIDTNVVMDVVFNNAKLIDGSRAILDHAEQKRFTGYISATAITDIFYLSKKRLGKKVAKEAIKELLQIFYPATITDNHIYQALDLDWNDGGYIPSEDSVQFIVGESLAVNYIITRNTEDFSSGSIIAITPEQFLQAITS